jgi:hypothetical protein
MKKLLLSVSALFFVAYASSQVICKGISPAAIAGNYTFTWSDPAGGWGTPDFLIPNTSHISANFRIRGKLYYFLLIV